MIKLGIPEEEVKFVIQKGVIDLITVIPVEHLNPKGMAFVAAKIYDYCAELYGKGSDEYKESEKRWDDFWADYFMPQVSFIGFSHFSCLCANICFCYFPAFGCNQSL